MTALYNEIDDAAAHTLRHMIDIGVIAPGVVIQTSIKELTPDDLKGFTQIHLFAGGGLWSIAARLAGWPDDEPLWTASCPCQPFSAAGKGAGTDDPRHLWPDVYRLASALRPAVIMGEQVAGAAGYGWFDGVRADLENEGFAARTVDFPACGVDAPHQRNRQYWLALAMAKPDEFGGRAGAGRGDGAEALDAYGAERSGVTLGDDFGSGLEGQRGHGDTGRGPEPRGSVAATDGGECVSPDAALSVLQGQPPAGQQPGDQPDAGVHANASSVGRRERRAEHELRGGRSAAANSPLRNGTYWSDAEWITCHDDKARRTKPGLRNVAHGVPGGMDHRGGRGNEDVQEASQAPDYGFLVKGMIGRVDLWRMAGNAIVPWAAAEVIRAYMEVYREDLI